MFSRPGPARFRSRQVQPTLEPTWRHPIRYFYLRSLTSIAKSFTEPAASTAYVSHTSFMPYTQCYECLFTSSGYLLSSDAGLGSSLMVLWIKFYLFRIQSVLNPNK